MISRSFNEVMWTYVRSVTMSHCLTVLREMPDIHVTYIDAGGVKSIPFGNVISVELYVVGEIWSGALLDVIEKSHSPSYLRPFT